MFVSEPIKPIIVTGDAGAMASGSPTLPREFVWRGEPLVVTEVIRSWRETSPCRHGSGEIYARKHWFEVLTTHGDIAKLYFERQSRGPNRTARWWLFSMTAEPEAG